MRIVLTGGGSGGHLTPFEPIIDALRVEFQERQHELPRRVEPKTLDIYFIGIVDDAAREFFDRLDVKTVHIPSGKLRRYSSSHTIGDILFRLPIGVLRALWHMWNIMPNAIVVKGGYGSLPVGFAAMVYRIPYLLHESDAVMGIANRILSVGAAVIAVNFAQTRHGLTGYRRRTVVTGVPVRLDLQGQEKEEAKRYFGFEVRKRVLLVTGGSQGAKQLNDIIVAALPSLLSDIGIIHVTGEKHVDVVTKHAARVLTGSPHKDQYKIFGYLRDDMGKALAAADVVVARAGATTLAELAYLGKAAIVIPLDGAAGDHQRINASLYETAEGVRVIDPANLGRALLEQNIRALISDDDLRITLEKNIRRLARPSAGRDIAALTISLSLGLVPSQPLEGKK